MSSDNAFAAQFWLWPDPAMKRDSHGRIIFVNNAFLNLYGGTVETWTGNVLQGWPAPQPPQQGGYPVPNRFETRVPSHDPQQSEQVYDWMEQTEENGNAFALARNVSFFVEAQTAAPVTATAAASAANSEPALQQHQAIEDAPQTEPQYAQIMPSEATEIPPVAATAEVEAVQAQYQAPAQTPIHEAPAEQQAPVTPPQAAEQTMPAPQQATPDAPTHQHEDDQNHLVAFQHETIAPELAPTPAMDTNPIAAAPEQTAADDRDERSFERRALPLEANSTVLGNNWRDAVIAKAVGGEDETPMQEPAVSPQASNTSSEEESGPNKRILLAEDNAINALLTRTLLEAEGHIVETVEDGALAVEAMKTQSFDLIFMDMRMPNMDGLESTRKIRQLPNVPKSLPIIALTANAFDDDRNACFDSGMNDFMTKPVSADELSEMVKTWTDKKKLEMAS